MSKSQFVCQSCGAVTHKWSGHCDACDSWNTISEERGAAPASGAKGVRLPKGRPSRLVGLKGGRVTILDRQALIDVAEAW